MPLDSGVLEPGLVVRNLVHSPGVAFRVVLTPLTSNLCHYVIVTHAFPSVPYAHYYIELTAAQNHKDPATLDNASQLVWQLNRIPRVVQRMECHEIAFSWPAAANSAASQLGVIECACQELGRSQENMRQLLSIVLSVGNYLNGGTPRGQVRVLIYYCYSCTTIMCVCSFCILWGVTMFDDRQVDIVCTLLIANCCAAY
jgi:hypothetical protein